MTNEAPSDIFISGYLATFVYNPTTRLYTGRFVGLRGNVLFVAHSWPELQRSGLLALDDYLAEIRNKEPK